MDRAPADARARTSSAGCRSMISGCGCCGRERRAGVMRGSDLFSTDRLEGQVWRACPTTWPHRARSAKHDLTPYSAYRTRNRTREHVAEPVELARAAGRELQQRERDEAERDAVRDADRERHRDERQKRRNRLGQIVPPDVRARSPSSSRRRARAPARRSDRARRCRRAVSAANHLDERIEEQREQKQRRRDDAGEPGAAAGRDARRALDVGRHRRRAERGADDRADRVGQQRLPGARQRAVPARARCGSPTPMSVPTESNSARKKEHEHDVDEPGLEGAEHIELEERRRERRRRARRRPPNFTRPDRQRDRRSTRACP